MQKQNNETIIEIGDDDPTLINWRFHKPLPNEPAHRSSVVDKSIASEKIFKVMYITCMSGIIIVAFIVWAFDL